MKSTLIWRECSYRNGIELTQDITMCVNGHYVISEEIFLLTVVK